MRSNTLLILKAFVGIVVFIISINTISAQPKHRLLGVYERKWSAHSSMTIYPDSTFSEKYLSFFCGLYASALDDTVFKGRWSVNKNILKLYYNPTKHHSSWNVSEYFIDTFYGILTPIDVESYNYMSYVKTKAYNKKGSQIWEFNPLELTKRFYSLLPNENEEERNKIFFLLEFWIEVRKKLNLRGWKHDLDLSDIIDSDPDDIYQQIYFIGRLKYNVKKPQDKSIDSSIRAGLQEMTNVYKSKLINNKHNKFLDNLVLEEVKDQFNSFIIEHLK